MHAPAGGRKAKRAQGSRQHGEESAMGHPGRQDGKLEEGKVHSADGLVDQCTGGQALRPLMLPLCLGLKGKMFYL